MTELERRYRRLLRAFPRRYRTAREEEMVATLLEAARPDQHRPSAGDVADILRSALAERMGVHTVSGFATGLRLFAPAAVVFAGGLATSDWLQGHHDAVSTVVAASWVAALFAAVVAPRLWSWLLGGVVVVELAAVAISGIQAALVPLVGQGGQFREGYYTAELAATVVAALAALTVHWRPSTVELGGIVLATAALLGVTATGRVGLFGYGPPWLVPVPPLIGIMLIAGLILAAAGRGTGGLWAALLLLTIAPSTVAPGRPTDLLPSLMATAGILFVAALTALAVWLAANHRRRSDEWNALTNLGGIALGTASAVAAVTLIAGGNHSPVELALTLVPVGAAAVVPWLPNATRRPAIALAIVSLIATSYLGRVDVNVWHYTVTLASLLFLAAAARRIQPRLVAGSAGLALVMIAGLGGLMALGFAFPTTILAPMIGTLPLLLAVIWGPVVAVRSTAGWLGAMFAFAVALFWISFRLELTRDPLLVLMSLGGAVGLVLLARLTVRLRARIAVRGG